MGFSPYHAFGGLNHTHVVGLLGTGIRVVGRVPAHLERYPSVIVFSNVARKLTTGIGSVRMEGCQRCDHAHPEGYHSAWGNHPLLRHIKVGGDDTTVGETGDYPRYAV